MAQLLAEGRYFGLPVETFMDSNKNGTAFVGLKWRLTHVLDGEEWKPLHDEVYRFMRLYLSDEAWDYTCQKLEALGFNGDFENPELNPETIKNGFELILKHDKDKGNGKVYENLDLAEWGGERERRPPAKDQTRLFAQRWKQRQGDNKKPTGKPQLPSTGDTEGKNELPF